LGLETVAIVMQVEDEFNVFIPDDVTPQLRTVGDLHQFLLQQKARPIVTSGACPSSFVFYRIRRSLMKHFHVARRAVRPDTRLDQLLPQSQRRIAWTKLASALKLPLPDLQFPPGVRLALWSTPVIAAVVTVLCLLPHVSLSDAAPFGMTALLVGWAIAFFARPFRTHVPARCATVGRLATHLATRHRSLLAEPAHLGTPEEVWLKLKQIVIDQTGVAPELVRPEARWYEDLGAG